jgi:hypothetical protein
VGFQRKTTTYRLTFEGTDLDGLVVTVRSVSVGAMLDLVGLAEADTRKAADIAHMFDTLGDALDSWNLEDGGVPVPADRTGVRSLGVPEAMALVKAWSNVMQDVPGPLDQPSTGGVPSAALSLPMEPLLANRAS